jgi:Helix-turn-helix domain
MFLPQDKSGFAPPSVDLELDILTDNVACDPEYRAPETWPAWTWLQIWTLGPGPEADQADDDELAMPAPAPRPTRPTTSGRSCRTMAWNPPTGSRGIWPMASPPLSQHRKTDSNTSYGLNGRSTRAAVMHGSCKGKAMSTELLKPKQAAEHLGLCTRSLNLLVARGKIPAYRIGPRGGRTMFNPADLESYIKSCRQVGGRRW